MKKKVSMIIGKLSVLNWSVFKIAANVPHIAEGGEYEAQQFISALNRHFWQYAVIASAFLNK